MYLQAGFFFFFKIDFKPPPPLPNPQIPPPHKKNNDDGFIMTGVIYGQAPVCLSICQAHSGQLTGITTVEISPR